MEEGLGGMEGGGVGEGLGGMEGGGVGEEGREGGENVIGPEKTFN